MVLRSGRVVMEPRASPAAAGNVAELLRTVPGLSVDADGNLTMRGSPNVLVLVDGRRTPLTGEALIAFLRQLPANAVERVEAGTAGSAAEEANGAAGVVNLVLRTTQDAERHAARRSVAGMLAGWNDYNGSALASGHVSDAVHWDAMYSLSAMRRRTSATVERWAVVLGDLPLTTDARTRGWESHRLHSVVAGLAAVPRAGTTLSLRGTYSRMQGVVDDRRASAFSDEAGNTASSLTGRTLEHRMPSGELVASARVEGRRVRFATEARVGGVREDHRGSYRDLGAGFEYRSARMAVRQRNHVLRNDLSFLVAGWELAVGHESRLRDVEVEHDALHFTERVVQRFGQELDVHGGYLNAARAFGGVRTEVGVRVEGERALVALDDASERVRRGVRVFPALAAEWTDVGRGLVYRVGYGRRVTRPDARMLNPYAMGEGEDEEVLGSDDLRAELIDQVELGVERHRGFGTVHLTPFVRWMREPMRVVWEPNARGGVTGRMRNLEWERAVGADVGVRAGAGDAVDVTVGGTVARMESVGSGVRNVGTSTSARVLVELRVSASTTAQVLVARPGGEIVPQGEALDAATGEVALSRRLDGGRGVLTLRVSDPFRSDRVGHRVAGGGFSEARRGFARGPVLGVSASFAVGADRR